MGEENSESDIGYSMSGLAPKGDNVIGPQLACQ